MPQALLPLFPPGATHISELLSFEKREGKVYYFHGCLPVFAHAEEDRASFRMFTSQLVVNGNCKQVEIVKAFGVSTISVKRWVKKYRERGPSAFFTAPPPRKPRVLTKEVMQQAQEKLSEGMPRSEVAKEMGLKADTLSKAIRVGRLAEPVKKTVEKEAPRANGA